MFTRLAVRLTLTLALTLAAACSDDPPSREEDEGSARADDDEAPLGDDESDDAPTDDALTDDDAPTDDDDAPSMGARDGSRPRPDAAVPADTDDEPAEDGDAGSARDDAGEDTDSPSEDKDEPGKGDGSCCADGDCLCHGPEPTELTSMDGPYNVDSYTVDAGCVYYPTDAEGPLAAVTISDGFGGSGGCGFSQTGNWGPFYASWGIVAMIVNTTGGDRPEARGTKLLEGIDAFKAENDKSGSPLEGKLSGRYSASGFSMGGGGSSFAARDGDGLRSSVAIMPWGPVRSGVDVPTLVICGASDTIASCNSHGAPLYASIDDGVPKMRVQVSGGHSGQPEAGRGMSGAYGLAFQKVFLEGDERWRPLLVDADAEESNIQ